MYPYSTLVNIIPTFWRISLVLVTYRKPIRHFAAVINLTGIQCEINHVRRERRSEARRVHHRRVLANRKAELRCTGG